MLWRGRRQSDNVDDRRGVRMCRGVVGGGIGTVALWREFTATMLADKEDVWGAELQAVGGRYREPKLVIFSGGTDSACGTAGDFPRACVIAQEIGHHVQNLLGTSVRVHELQQRDPGAANQLSVRLELQADCYAGLWTRRLDEAGHVLEPGDIEEGLKAASAIGDDTLQRSAGRAVVPDAFTHGSSAQRMRWFKRGFDTGSLEACDTFREADV